MDLNAGLLTLIGEQRVSLFEKDKHIENLVKINNDLAQELQDTKAYAAKIEESNNFNCLCYVSFYT